MIRERIRCDAPHLTAKVQTMSPTENLKDDLYRDRLLRARRMSAEEKLSAGPRLFESACRITLAGIHNQSPSLTEAEMRNLLRQRLEWRRRLDQTPLTREQLHGH